MNEQLRARYGSDELPEAPRIFTPGDWSLELVDGDVKNLRFAGQEVIRSIGYVVRDGNWGTLKQRHDEPQIEQTDQALVMRLTSRCKAEDGSTLTIERTLRLGADEPLTFSARACPDGDMQTARSGFTVLYPLKGVSGSPVTVTAPDGGETHDRFPLLIEPWQPFKNIGRLQYQHAAGLQVTTDYQGDIFEMEDQRAWSDGSYKVYSRPLEKPWPYTLAAGDAFSQTVTVAASAQGETQAVAPPARQSAALPNRIPAIGLLITEAQCQDMAAVARAIAQLAPQYLLAHYAPGDNSGDFLTQLAQLQRRLPDTPLLLEYVLPVQQGEQFAGHLVQLKAEINACRLQLAALIPSPAPDLTSTPPGSQWPWCPPLTDIYRQARTLFPDLQLGGGMLSYFTELNRKRPPVAEVDFITHATCPIVHAADDRSVMQTLESLPFITDTTRSFIGTETPYLLGPSMISMRSNPYGTSVYPNPQHVRLTMTNADVRHRGLFYASWLVGYLAGLAQSGISHWCPGALSGPLGLQPLLHPQEGEHWPAWHLVRWLAANSGADYQPSTPLEGVVALTINNGGRRIWLVTNTHSETLRVTLPDAARQLRFVLDDRGYRQPVDEPLAQQWSLTPYSVLAVELTA